MFAVSSNTVKQKYKLFSSSCMNFRQSNILLGTYKVLRIRLLCAFTNSTTSNNTRLGNTSSVWTSNRSGCNYTAIDDALKLALRYLSWPESSDTNTTKYPHNVFLSQRQREKMSFSGKLFANQFDGLQSLFFVFNWKASCIKVEPFELNNGRCNIFTNFTFMLNANISR